jgi:transcriptional regulator with XRE-family HTH domain
MAQEAIFAMGDEGISARLRSVRDEYGMTQIQFVPVLNKAALALGIRTYTQPTLSKLETGAQEASLDDIAVYARIDRKGRGMLWLGWGLSTDATLARPTNTVSILGREIDRSAIRTATAEELAEAKRWVAEAEAAQKGAQRRTERGNGPPKKRHG